MHKKLPAILFILLLSTCIFAQKDDALVFKINGKPVYWAEVKKAYDKGNEFAEEKQTMSQFIESYADFKMNIEEARAQGLDKKSAYRKLYDSFKNQMAGPFMIKDTLYESIFMRKIYDRLLENVEVNHIVVPFERELVLPADTLVVYRKALEIREKILKEGFDIEGYRSDDLVPFMTKTEDRNGYLGWITAFMMPYKIEHEIYNLPLKEVSLPVRSPKGYHIVQVLDRRPAAGSVEVEQVLFNFPSIPASKEQIDSVRAVAEREYEYIHTIGDFTELCEEFSRVHQTGDKGCYFGILGLDSSLPPDFTMGAFNLQNPGDVSKPVMSNYGFHILRLLRKIPVPDYDKLKDKLRERITKSDKAQELSDGSRLQMVKGLNIDINQKAYNELLKITETLSPRDSAFISNIKNSDDILLSIDGKQTFPVREFAKYLKMRQRMLEASKQNDELVVMRIEEATPYSLSTDILKEYFDAFLVILAQEYEKYTLEERSPEFKAIMDEYSEGLLLFDVKDQNIWKRAQSDEEGLSRIFSENQSKYSLDGEKYKGMILHARTESDLDKAKEVLKNTTSRDDFIEKMRQTVNKDSVVVKIEPGLWVKGNSPYVDHKIFGGEEPKVHDRVFPHYFVTGKFIIKPEDYTDVRSEVEADYQEKLEKEWAGYLRNKYTVEYNNSLMKKLK